MREFEKLIRKYFQLEDSKSQFKVACRTNLSNLNARSGDPIQLFFVLARSAQYIATLANWRRTPGNVGSGFPSSGTPNVFRIESLPIANLNNVSCVASIDDVMSIVEGAVNSYSPDTAATTRIDDWVVSSLKGGLEDSAKLIEKFGGVADPNGSLDIVDLGLQHIAGYWLSQGETPHPVPYVPVT